MKVGQREGLSRGDVKKVNAMYNCKKESVVTSVTPYRLCCNEILY